MPVTSASARPLARSTVAHRGGPPPAAGARRIRRTALASEQLLLESAQRAFSDKGYVRTTVQDIIADTGLSRGAFYRYFSSTDDIFLTLCKRVVNEMLRPSGAPAGHTLRERVHAGNLHYLQQFECHRGMLRALFEAAYVQPAVADQQARLRNAYLERARAHLQRQQARGACLRIDIEAASIALGMMVEGAAQLMGNAPFEPAPKLDRLCAQVTDNWCRAVYCAPDQLLSDCGDATPAAPVPPNLPLD